MTWDRLYLKNRIKSSMFQQRGVEDGLLTDDLIDESINEAIKVIVFDCNLNWRYGKLALREGVYAYVLPEDLLAIRRVWFRNSDDYRYPIDYLSPEKFLDNIDPTDTSSEPNFFTYPNYQGRVFEFYGPAAPIYDYLPDSYVTEATIRTIVDSGINFGKTLDRRPIEPGDLVHNLTDDSYAYVEALDFTTAATTGTCTPNTSNVLIEDTTKNFQDAFVEENFIICKPAAGYVTAWATVAEVPGTTQLKYRDYQDPTGKTSGFLNGDTYKVGRATEIRLSILPPHPGLRSGGRNYFSVSDAKATITGTTFTYNRCNGTGTTGAETGDIAIASGGYHGKITAVAAGYIDVDYWIGGIPTDGEEVSVRECDRYQVESRFPTEPVMWITPAPNEDDTLGQESLEILYNRYPTMPENDSDLIPVPEKYRTPLLHCVRWQCYLMKGNTPEEKLIALEETYKRNVKDYLGDIWKVPRSRALTPWGNRYPSSARLHRYTTRSGARYDASGFE